MVKKYHIFTLGCQMNHSDSEKLSYILDQLGLGSVPEKKADLIIVNACSVRQKPIDRVWGKIKIWRKLKTQPLIVLTGCVLDKDLRKLRPKFDFWFPITGIENFISWLENKLDPLDKDKISDFQKNDYLDIKAKNQKGKSALVPIMSGCDNFCSYCAVPFTRGREWSRDEKSILEEVQCLVKKGYKEIVLLGQNVCSYQNKKYKSKHKNYFVLLLKRIAGIPGDFRIKFLSPHPKDISLDLIELIAKEPKLSKEIHLPLQSGDKKILKNMNRGYSPKDFLEITKKLREKVSELKLSTDIIVGFPNEDKKSFGNTVRLVKSCQLNKAFIAMYSPRPGTLAEQKMTDNVPLEEKRRRWRILDNLINKKASLEVKN